MNRLNDLLLGLHNWRTKTGKFLYKLPVSQLEEHRLLPTYYRTEAWYLGKIAEAMELETEDCVFPVSKKV